RRARARSESLHGRHHVALPGQIRGIHRPLRRGVCQEPRAALVDAVDPGRFPASARQPPASRSDLDAANPTAGGAARAAAQPYSPGTPRPGDLDARRAGPARPVDEPAVAHLLLVTALLRDMNTGTIIDAPAAGDPNRTALMLDERIVTYAEL